MLSLVRMLFGPPVTECKFHIIKRDVSDRPFMIEVKAPWDVAYYPLSCRFGYDMFTHPTTFYWTLEEAEKDLNNILDCGYYWSREHQCYLIYNYVEKKENPRWKEFLPTIPLFPARQIVPMSCSGRAATG